MVVAGFMTMPEVKFKLRPRGDWVISVINKEWETAEKGLGKVMGTDVDLEDT